MAKYLVTGGCGFIGSHLCEKLTQEGHSVVVIDDLSTGKKENLPANAVLHIDNLTDEILLYQILNEVQGCFHLAAIASVEACAKNWISANDTNLRTLQRIFSVIRKLPETKRVPVIYASSAAVYGECEDLPLTEEKSVHPVSAYGADKLACELFAKVAAKTYDIPNAGLRFFNVFGPRQDPRSPYAGVIAKFLDRFILGQSIEIFGDGQQTRDFIFVKDIVEGCMAALKAVSLEAPVYNLCTNKQISVQDLVNNLQTITGNKVDTSFSPARSFEILNSLGSFTKAQADFDFEPKHNFSEGLKQLYLARKEELNSVPQAIHALKTEELPI